MFYGWARLRIASEDPRDLPGMVEEIQAHYGKVGLTGIDVVWPSGTAQEQLLYEAVPGAPVEDGCMPTTGTGRAGMAADRRGLPTPR